MSNHNPHYGNLYLIPTTLGDNEPLEVIPISIKGTIERINHYIVENEKSARRFIKKISPRKSQPGLQLRTLNKFTEPEHIASLLRPCFEGKHMAILSDAGCPAIADPGAEVVRIAHRENIRVIPLVGPSSIILALMASGMNGQMFAFNGYLPIEPGERRKTIKRFEKVSKEFGQTQIFIETPYRNDSLLADLIKSLSGHTRLSVACDLTLSSEIIATRTVSEWKESPLPILHKRPAVFLFQA